MRIERTKAKENQIPTRQYPSYTADGKVRRITLGKSSFTVPYRWTYYQYLILGVYTMVFSKEFLNDDNNDSVLRKMYKAHIDKVQSETSLFILTNADAYLIYLASDLEQLVAKNSLPEGIIKRLRSTNDGEMRGAIYEITMAAAVTRTGYKIDWLTEPSRPEFTAYGKEVLIDFEAKRRDRTGRINYDLEIEVRAIEKNLRKALKKKTMNQYVIFMDTDLPPGPAQKYNEIMEAMMKKIGLHEQKKIVVVTTNTGYEHDPTVTDFGKNSVAMYKSDDGVNLHEVKKIILQMHAKLPKDASSSGWPI
ncbi:MAG: hypothetical protein ABIQ04_01655 [Candidatus Saccharimonadales bacterium]